MHYLLLLIGVVIGLYGLYRFFLNADVKQITALFMTAALLAVCTAMFFLAVTGRLPAALALLLALLPILLPYWKARKLGGVQQNKAESGPMTREEALEVLGLAEGVSTEEINKAYKQLMKKVHPDQEGSDWMAVKLNQARDILLKG